MSPFQIKDCALIVRICSQLPAVNLRELRERIATVQADSLYHHFCENVLRPSFDDPEFHNDFAIWARRALHDHVLAERLGILDPYSFPSTEDLRKEVLEILDDRLSELHYIPWASHNRDFFFSSATTVVFDTNSQIDSPADLGSAVAAMTTSSLYYHFWEARRRTPDRLDDFSVWLRDWDHKGQPLVEAFSHIDFYFLSLRELQAKICQTINDLVDRNMIK
jgi:hypothetical protein